MIGRLIEKQKLRVRQQDANQRQASLLPAAQKSNRRGKSQCPKTKRRHDLRHTPGVCRGCRESGQRGIVLTLEAELSRRVNERLSQLLNLGGEGWDAAVGAREKIAERFIEVQKSLRQITNAQVGRSQPHCARVRPILSGQNA